MGEAMSGLLGFLSDEQARRDMAENARNLAQSASNSIAGNITGPVDAIAWALRKAGVPVGNEPIGGSDWGRRVGLLGDVTPGASAVAGETLGLLAPIVGQAKAPEIARGLLSMADNAMKPKTLNPQTGAIVWHGSPHKFDKFDSSKIGTGEGAQAYGHGLYLAESPDVAKSYQKIGEVTSIGGKPVSGGRTAAFDAPDGMSKEAVNILGLNNWNVKQALDELGDSYSQSKTIGDKSYYMDLIRQIKQIPQNKIESTGGALYKVDLPDEAIAKMLDWDKPLNQQAPEVQAVLGGIANNGGVWTKTALQGKSTTGGQLYLSDLQNDFPDAVAATEALRKAGIPGIRYLDGGSRGAGAGTSNFVVFPGGESMLKIIERNGLLMP